VAKNAEPVATRADDHAEPLLEDEFGGDSSPVSDPASDGAGTVTFLGATVRDGALDALDDAFGGTQNVTSRLGHTVSWCDSTLISVTDYEPCP